MKILLTGGTGSLGSELKIFFPDCLCPTSDKLDIKNKEDVLTFFQNNDIDIVIHTAAITSVRFCEENKLLAWKTNVDGTRNIVNAILKSKNNIKLIYVSTACIFDGHSSMYKENDIPYPENFYALTKLIGEHEISRLNNYLIIRTNFVAKKPWPYPKAFTDRFGTYLFAENVAFGIKEIVDSNVDGVIHRVGDKKLSMFDLAKITTPLIEPMTINDYHGPRLTMDMSLDTEKWKKYTLK